MPGWVMNADRAKGYRQALRSRLSRAIGNGDCHPTSGAVKCDFRVAAGFKPQDWSVAENRMSTSSVLQTIDVIIYIFSLNKPDQQQYSRLLSFDHLCVIKHILVWFSLTL